MLHKHAKFKDSLFMKKIASGEIKDTSMDVYKHRLITRNTKHAQFANSIISTYNDVCGEDVSDKVSVEKIAEMDAKMEGRHMSMILAPLPEVLKKLKDSKSRKDSQPQKKEADVVIESDWYFYSVVLDRKGV